MTLLKTEDVESGRYAAFALSNLAANANHRQQIVDEGGPEALVALACCEDLNAQRQALSALRGLCISPPYRVLVVRQGILDPLVGLRVASRRSTDLSHTHGPPFR